MLNLKQRLHELSIWTIRMRIMYHWGQAESEETLIAVLQHRDPYEYIEDPFPDRWGTTVAEVLMNAEKKLARHIRKLDKLGIKYKSKSIQSLRLVS